MRTAFDIDPAHHLCGEIAAEGLSRKIWQDKYKAASDNSWADTARRVTDAVYAKDCDAGHHAYKELTYEAIRLGLLMPAGRVIAGAGTGKRVTLNNCYVTGTIEDSMEGIMREHTNFALTMQQGGGDGADFSTIRPEGAILRRTGSRASGPLPFMHMWNSMCGTIMSAGDRRGAMMATMKDTHPDLPKFITAKHTKGALTNFNISVLVSDAFISAVQEDAEWLLYFHEEPLDRDPELAMYDFHEDGKRQYVYSVWRARFLWDMIMRSTYEYAEPGILFIDRINDLNNLKYVETISCTNPCAEEPLPPHGCCNLSHINLARLVRKPFTSGASFDWDMLATLVSLGVRFLDNVIDVTNFPLSEQEAEQMSKRRIGLGHAGLADVFHQMGIRYGSYEAVAFAERVQEFICQQAYAASSALAAERGTFPLFNADQYLSGTFAGMRLPQGIKDNIRQYGMRNGILLTIAPTGTMSLVYLNIAGGLEPTFAHVVNRKVRQADDSFVEHTEWSYSARLWNMLHPESMRPAHMVEAEDLSIHDHIGVMAAMQKYVDASISKTINCPAEMKYEDFVQVYMLAYNAGAKGCTTYRPSGVRGSVLENAAKQANQTDAAGSSSTDGNVAAEASTHVLRTRPKALDGRTYQIKWPNRDASLYLTINHDEAGRPFEILINSKDGTQEEWTKALSLMITAILRTQDDVAFISNELKQIKSVSDGAWVDGKYISSLPAYIGTLLEPHLSGAIPLLAQEASSSETMTSVAAKSIRTCPKCGAPTLEKSGTCETCHSCGYSKCG